MSVLIQKYMCEACKHEGEVRQPLDAGDTYDLFEIYFKMEQDHKFHSPKCSCPTDKILIYPPEIR